MNTMNTYIITRPAAWANTAELEATAKISARIGDEQMPDRVRWIRSYVTEHENGRHRYRLYLSSHRSGGAARARAVRRHAS
jgi:hypothetical protein